MRIQNLHRRSISLLVSLAATACEPGTDADVPAESDADTGVDASTFADAEPVDEANPGADAPAELQSDIDPKLAGVVKSTLRSIKVSGFGGLSATPKISYATFNFEPSGYTWVRPVEFGTTRYMFLMRSQSGEVDIYNINTNDTLGTKVASYNFAKTWSNVEIGQHGSTTYLFLHNSETGELRRHVFNSNGTITTGSYTTLSHADWQDIGNLSSYRIGSTLFLEGLDPWSGKNRVYTGALSALTSDTWTSGWTTIDHTTIGSTGYILAYKSAGDAYTTSNDATQVGRLSIQTIDASGNKTSIYDSNAVGGGFTTVRFLTVWETATTTSDRILFYNANTGAYELYRFSPSSGLGMLQSSGTTALYAGDIATYTTASETFVQLLDEEERPLFDPGQVKKTAACVHSQLTGPANDPENVVGYQFGLTQFGRVLHRRAFGYSRMSPLTAMSTRRQQDLGSVSKMFTTMTVMKLADLGLVDLDSSVVSNLSNTEYPAPGSGPAYWPEHIKVRDLLTQQSGTDGESLGVGCVGDPTTLETLCDTFLDAGQTDTAAPCKGSTSPKCGREYDNAHFGTAREVIENAQNVYDSPGIVQVTRNLWATALGISSTCESNANMWYFSQATSCTPGVGACVAAPDGTNRTQLQYSIGNTGNYSESCGAGGWNASVQELLRFMAGIQYAKVLSPAFNDQLLNMSLTTPSGRTAMGWGGRSQEPENAWAGPNSDQMTLSKGGGHTNSHTTIGTLPDQAAYVLLINSDGDDKRSVIKEAYQFGIGVDASCTDQW